MHAIIRRGKNEGTVGEWMRWTFFPPFCLSSFLFTQRVLCRFCCRCCTTPPQRNAESVAESRLGLRLFYMWSNHHLLRPSPPPRRRRVTPFFSSSFLLRSLEPRTNQRFEKRRTLANPLVTERGRIPILDRASLSILALPPNLLHLLIDFTINKLEASLPLRRRVAISIKRKS